MGRPRSDPMRINAPCLRALYNVNDSSDGEPSSSQLACRVRAALQPRCRFRRVSEVLHEIVDAHIRRLPRRIFGHLTVTGREEMVLCELSDVNDKENTVFAVNFVTRTARREQLEWLRPTGSMTKSDETREDDEENFSPVEKAVQWRLLDDAGSRWECRASTLRPVLFQLISELLRTAFFEELEFRKAPAVAVEAVVEAVEALVVRQKECAINGTASKALLPKRLHLDMDDHLVSKSFLTLNVFEALQELTVCGRGTMVELDAQVFRALPQLARVNTANSEGTTLTLDDLNWMLKDFAELRRDLVEIQTTFVLMEKKVEEVYPELLKHLNFQSRRKLQSKKVVNNAHGVAPEKCQGVLAKSVFVTLRPLDYRRFAFVLAETPLALKQMCV